jgi:hypothetical protein
VLPHSEKIIAGPNAKRNSANMTEGGQLIPEFIFRGFIGTLAKRFIWRYHHVDQ